jgi:hypothetical protein
MNHGGVLDTNQAARLPHFHLYTGTNQIRKRLTLSPMVLAEILLRENPGPTLARLRGYKLRFGNDLRPAFDRFANSGGSFDPFVSATDVSRLNFLMAALKDPTDHHRSWAREQKATVRSYLEMMKKGFLDSGERFKAAGVKPSKYQTLDEALTDDFMAYRQMVVHVMANGTMPIASLERDAFFDRIMESPKLRRFWRAFLFCLVSWGKQWRVGRNNQQRNFGVAPDRDDMTDLILLLYADDGDSIITGDKLLPSMLPEVEPSGVIKVCSAENF